MQIGCAKHLVKDLAIVSAHIFKETKKTPKNPNNSNDNQHFYSMYYEPELSLIA